mgnify:CR=1 FL=1
MTKTNKQLKQGVEALKKGVKCPYCNVKSDKIDVGQTNVTLLYPEPHPPPTYDPNTYTSEYKCRNCGKRFGIDRKAELVEEYVFEEEGRTKRVKT